MIRGQIRNRHTSQDHRATGWQGNDRTVRPVRQQSLQICPGRNAQIGERNHIRIQIKITDEVGIRAIFEDKSIGTGTTRKRIIAGTAIKDVIPGRSKQSVIACTTSRTFDTIKGISAINRRAGAIFKIDNHTIGLVGIIDDIVAFATNQGIITSTARKRVIACTAINDVVRIIASQRIIMTGANQRFETINSVTASTTGGSARIQVDIYASFGIFV